MNEYQEAKEFVAGHLHEAGESITQSATLAGTISNFSDNYTNVDQVRLRKYIAALIALDSELDARKERLGLSS